MNSKILKIVLLLIIILGLVIFVFRKDEETPTDNFTSVWNPETASFDKYSSSDELEREREAEQKEELEKYEEATKGTVVEQVKNVAIPSYFDEDGLAQLEEGKVEVRSEKSNDFPEGTFQWGAEVIENVDYYTIGDFNNDGLDDVAHVIGYTGGGSGYFYELTVFINKNGKLEYLAQKILGDRVVLKGIEYNSNEFIVDMITHGKGDDFLGYCCPNIPVIIKLELLEGELNVIN